MKKIFFLLLAFSFITLNAQLDRVSGGLGFSSGVDYNKATTGNPAIFGKAYIKLMKRLHVIPALSVYNKGQDGSQFTDDIRRNYMFQADLDAQYGLFKEDQLTLVGFTGINMTSVISRIVGDNTTLENMSAVKPGLNLGVAVEMQVNPSYDACVSAKYVVSEFSQFVINIGVVYRFNATRRRGW